MKRMLARACALPAAAGIIALTATAASAHVSITPEEGEAGAFTVLTASVPHGCDGSPTTKVAIAMPEQVLAVTPTRNSSWDVEKKMEKLAEPVQDSHGNEVTERVAQVVYTARSPLPEGYRDAFELSLQLPDAAGETLVFPVIQTCAKGETAWTETASDGNTEELEAPAPTVDLLPAGDEGGQATSTADQSQAPQSEPAEAGESNALGIAALVAGLLGLLAGVGALVQVRRRA